MDARFTLAWESERRTRAVIAAVLAGVLQAIAIPIQAAGLATPAHDDDLRLLHRLHGHGTTILVGTGMQILGLIAAAYALWYLYKAIQARRSEPVGPVGMEALVIAGPVVASVTVGAAEVLQTIGVGNFFSGSGPQTVATATATLKHGSEFVFGAYVAPVGALLFAVALVLVSLNAMRVGLLTRFIGVLGCLLGAFQVLPLLPPIVVSFFWFGALAALFAGRWPQGLPPAWASGRAEPWPSRQQLVEQRDKGRPPAGRPAGGRAGGLFGAWGASRQAPEPAEPEPEPVREAATAGARVRGAGNGSRPSGSASKKRKRKRRR